MALLLYFVPKTRSSRPRWLMEELGLPYELRRLDVSAGENKRADYLAVHPLGKVPALVDDGVTMIESAAIIMQLADKHADKGLAPAVGTRERGEYYQWLLFAMASVEAHLGQVMKLGGAAQRDEAALAAEKKIAREHLEVLEKALQGREFLVGNRFSAADIVVASTLAWATMLGVAEGLTACAAYKDRMLQRPAAKKAREG